MTTFAHTLLRWFDANKRDLPWRRARNLYRVWVSEIMLQQTQVATVIPYYRRFLRQFPTLRSLAQAPEQDVLKAWEGLGYYARARNLHRAAGIVLSEHGGRTPRTPEAFGALPGVGPYVAAAVMSIGAGHAIPAVDGNVLRVLCRRLGIGSDMRSKATRKKVERFLSDQIPAESPGAFNEAMMELGATVCVPRSPRCGSCPLSPDCVARQRGQTARLPRRAAARTIPLWHVSAAVILRGGRMFIQRRPSHGLLGGMWEFPGGKQHEGESPEEALHRECREELDVSLKDLSRLATVRHAYSHFRIVMTVFVCRIASGRIHTPLAYRWITPNDLDRYPFPAADRQLFPLLQRGIS